MWEIAALGAGDDGGIGDIVELNALLNHFPGEVFDEFKLLAMAKRLHDNIVEDGIEGEMVVGLEPIEEEMGPLPWAEGIEDEECIFSGGWVGEVL